MRRYVPNDLAQNVPDGDGAAIGQAISAGERAREAVSATEIDLAAELVRVGLWLGVLLIGLFLLVKFLPRWLRTRPAGAGLIDVVDRRAIEGRRALLLVRVGEQYFLVGSSESGLTLLSGGELRASELDALRAQLKSEASSERPTEREGGRDFQELMGQAPQS